MVATVFMVCAEHGPGPTVQGPDGRWRCACCKRDVGFTPVVDEYAPADLLPALPALLVPDPLPEWCPTCLTTLTDETGFCSTCGRRA